jgi:hypothetical protein
VSTTVPAGKHEVTQVPFVESQNAGDLHCVFDVQEV